MSLAQNPQAMAELDLGSAPGPDGQPQPRRPRLESAAAEVSSADLSETPSRSPES